MNRPIFLIGYMGSGKSSLGRQLAQEMGRDFIDLDKYIETRFHATVKQIFDERGEEGFRHIERNMIHEVAEFQDVVVACGGGGIPVYRTEGNHLKGAGAVGAASVLAACGGGNSTAASGGSAEYRRFND